MRSYALAVDQRRRFDEPLEDQPSDDLTMFEDALKTTGNEGKFVVKEVIELIREAIPAPRAAGIPEAGAAA